MDPQQQFCLKWNSYSSNLPMTFSNLFKSELLADVTLFCGDPSAKELIQAAIKVRNNAYAVYSNFQVGSALRTVTGEIYTGCNVENGAYSPSICAERTAICKAISEGHREISAIAVVAYQENSFTTPCGVCRQSISEFTTSDIPVYVAKPAPVRVLVTSIHKLLPMTFVPVF